MESTPYLCKDTLGIVFKFLEKKQRCRVAEVCTWYKFVADEKFNRQEVAREEWADAYRFALYPVYRQDVYFGDYCSRMLSVDGNLVKEYKNNREGYVIGYEIFTSDYTRYCMKPYYKKYRIMSIEVYDRNDSLARIELGIPNRKKSKNFVFMHPRVDVEKWWNLFPRPFMSHKEASDLIKRALK